MNYIQTVNDQRLSRRAIPKFHHEYESDNQYRFDKVLDIMACAEQEFYEEPKEEIKQVVPIVSKQKKFKKIKWYENPGWYTLAGFLIAQLIGLTLWLGSINGRLTEIEHNSVTQVEINKSVHALNTDVGAIKTDVSWIRAFMEKKIK